MSKKEKKSIDVIFKFINNNEEPIIIYKVDVSCGCISVDYTKEPIKKGASGYVKLTLDTKQLNGSFNKVAFVKTNVQKDKGVSLLRVMGIVK